MDLVMKIPFSKEVLSKMYVSDQWVKSTNGPLSPLHYALHSRLHLWKINSQGAANVCEKTILHICCQFPKSVESGWFAKRLHFLMHFIHPQGVTERKFSKLEVIGEPTRGVMALR